MIYIYQVKNKYRQNYNRFILDDLTEYQIILVYSKKKNDIMIFIRKWSTSQIESYIINKDENVH